MQTQYDAVKIIKTVNGWSDIMVLITKRKSTDMRFKAAIDRVAAS